MRRGGQIKSHIGRGSAELWRYKLEKPVGGSSVDSVDIIAVDLESDDGLKALGFSYVLAESGEASQLAAEHLLKKFILGHEVSHPEPIAAAMRNSLNRLGRGAHFIGMAAVDLALWDLYAKRLNEPVGVAMGGRMRETPVYASGGFNAGQSPDEAIETVRRHVASGFSAAKLRLASEASDRAVLRAVRDAIGCNFILMADVNEKGGASNAQNLLSAAAEFGVMFIEEPLPTGDIAGYNRLARLGGAPIALGEHLQGLNEASPFLLGGLCAVMQPDLAMMGGLTECLRVSRLAEACGVEITPHFLPSVFVHLAAASPAVTWLEDFPLLEPLFAGALTYENGIAWAPTAPGLGLNWADGAREAFRISD